MVKIRFERGQQDKQSREFGPFDFVQLTYEGLRIAPDGDWLANYTDGFWRLTDEKLTMSQEELDQEWSDVIIY